MRTLLSHGLIFEQPQRLFRAQITTRYAIEYFGARKCVVLIEIVLPRNHGRAIILGIDQEQITRDTMVMNFNPTTLDIYLAIIPGLV
jgi:hypothetical protein